MLNSCTQCRSKNLARDDTTGHLVCEDCGLLQEFDSFEAQIGGVSGSEGTFVRLGTVGAGTHYSYHVKKLLAAYSIIDDVSLKLGLSAAKSSDVKAMASEITDGEFGAGRWFPLFVGACAYVVMRTDRKSLPIEDVCSVVGTDHHELGRMINRVVEFLDLRRCNDYPEFDVVDLFERSLRNSPSFASAAGTDKMQRIKTQGVFLVQCMIKWSLTTGRRPVPAVAAVIAFVGEVNGIATAKIETLARELRAKLNTCKKRHRELLEALVKAAQVLPWGKNINIKNITKNATFVIQYMEKKSMWSRGENSQPFRLDLDSVVRDSLNKEADFSSGDELVSSEQNSKFLNYRKSLTLYCKDETEKLEISPECLSVLYGKAKVASKSAREVVRRRSGLELDNCTERWSGESELSKKLLLKQILEKDVGFEALPPAFAASCAAYEKRREKISAAKWRIKRVMKPPGSAREDCGLGAVGPARKSLLGGTIDWEDLIIEALLLRDVKEEEIETGHYNALMDLYVFNY